MKGNMNMKARCSAVRLILVKSVYFLKPTATLCVGEFEQSLSGIATRVSSNGLQASSRRGRKQPATQNARGCLTGCDT